MTDAATHDEIRALLDRVAAVADRLLPGELDLYLQLKARYARPCVVAFDDGTCLQVILRNVAVRGRTRPL